MEKLTQWTKRYTNMLGSSEGRKTQLPSDVKVGDAVREFEGAPVRKKHRK